MTQALLATSSYPPCSTSTLHSDTMSYLPTILYYAHHVRFAPPRSTMFTVMCHAHCAYQAPFLNPIIPAILYHATSIPTMLHCDTMPYQPTMLNHAPSLGLTITNAIISHRALRYPPCPFHSTDIHHTCQCSPCPTKLCQAPHIPSLPCLP